MTLKGEWIVPLKSRIGGTADMAFLIPKVDELSMLSCPLHPLPALLAWGSCLSCVEFLDLFTPDYCIREAGLGGSNPLTPAI